MEEPLKAVNVEPPRRDRFCNAQGEARPARRESMFATGDCAHQRRTSCGLGVPQEAWIKCQSTSRIAVTASFSALIGCGAGRIAGGADFETNCQWPSSGEEQCQKVTLHRACSVRERRAELAGDTTVASRSEPRDVRHIHADERLTTGTKRACPLSFGRLGGKLSEQSSARWGGDVLGSIVRSPDESGICLDRPHVYP